MNIGIYTRAKNKTIKILEKSLIKRGHKFILINNLNFDPTNPENTEFPPLDILYCWHGAGTMTSFGGRVSVCDYLREKGVRIINEATLNDPLFINKIYQLYKVSTSKTLAPESVIQIESNYEKIADKIGNPFILKSAVGTSGKRVALINDQKQLDHTAPQFTGIEKLYQKFIRNDGDYRVHVIGGKSVCAYKRTPESGEFRANVACGGKMSDVEDVVLKQRLFNIAEKVSESFTGMDIIGVDLILGLDDDQIYFIELNELPGIKQVQEVTGVNIADKMVDYFESLT